MKYLALATDYDGTLAHDGLVAPETIGMLKRVRASGRKLILVTGRQLPELLAIFPEIVLFDKVVAENGALLYTPSSRELKILATKPPDTFIQALKDRGVSPIDVGQVIIATWQPHETVVLDVIRQFGLELIVTFNKGAVMVLPSGINKSVGLKAALAQMKLSAHNIVGLGDGENDHVFLQTCECGVAVKNALPMLKEQADLVLDLPNGSGVAKICEDLVTDDLTMYESRMRRAGILLGARVAGEALMVSWHRDNVLIAGPSGSGKSSFMQGFLERCIKDEQQFCLIDAEGDYENLPGAVTVGSGHQKPNVEEILQLLDEPSHQVVVNLLGLTKADRPPFLTQLLPRLLELRLRTGRPHWILIDEAHHLMPTGWELVPMALPQNIQGMVLITVHPEHVATPALSVISHVIAIGDTPAQTLEGFAKPLGVAPPAVSVSPPKDHATAWIRADNAPPFAFLPARAELEHQRHRRKYAEGKLEEELSFYFRGPQEKLKLRAHNLETFVQLAQGVDDETWQHHLNNGDYTDWFKVRIKDEDLAKEAEGVAQLHLTAEESRRRIREAIERRYAPSA